MDILQRIVNMDIAERLSSLASAPNMNIPIRYIVIATTLTIGWSFPAEVSAMDKPFQEAGTPYTYIKLVQAVQTAPISEIPELAPIEQKPVVQAPVASDGSAKSFIYEHESGNNPSSVNSIGCRGLGQACPGTKLPCGDDYACQDAYFTNYMQGRYGTWENAKAFWLANHWW